MTEPLWSVADQTRAEAEGWSLRGNRIQMIPHGPFNSVDRLLIHLRARAKHGDEFAKRALTTHDGHETPPRSVMRYVATVHLVLPYPMATQSKICDTITDIMGNLIDENLIEDWGYARYGGHWLHPTRIPVNNPDHPDFPGNMLRYENDAI